jgi:hypothetical protein
MAMDEPQFIDADTNPGVAYELGRKDERERIVAAVEALSREWDEKDPKVMSSFVETVQWNCKMILDRIRGGFPKPSGESLLDIYNDAIKLRYPFKEDGK